MFGYLTASVGPSLVYWVYESSISEDTDGKVGLRVDYLLLSVLLGLPAFMAGLGLVGGLFFEIYRQVLFIGTFGSLLVLNEYRKDQSIWSILCFIFILIDSWKLVELCSQ